MRKNLNIRIMILFKGRKHCVIAGTIQNEFK